ncbi:cytochrome d ubiquinol oxidase subunit II [Fulvivirgaceae bacterium BMA10]|uniref:Cytochrome d ubiquinol oxidase subunit II n=1 Tax=Splendidivirga corallicola TaxID=3051826 RepID=A0ABT8KMV6_9BACT|nr:cytochrome d ubiquinol oxidase subunit II [Fulvivirgaceae bacterium BMA10]
MILHFIIVVLGIALLLYIIFGGADFGAGILELFSRKKHFTQIKNITYRTIGPVWEANHVWVILIVVILFMGFPKIYALISTALHIPILVMLLGIILRGTTFTFRHYDAYKDNAEKYYSKVFAYSSFITPLLLGMIAGAVISGKINLEANNFYDIYIAGWFHWFSFFVGIFTASICAFLAAIFLIGEADDEKLRRLFTTRAVKANIATVIAGGMVFISAKFEGISFFYEYWNNTTSILLTLFATFSLPVLWLALIRKKILLSRLVAGVQVSLIVMAWLWVQFPYVVKLKNGDHLSFYNTQAPESTLEALAIALLVGVMIIVPLLLFLFKTFNKLPTKA